MKAAFNSGPEKLYNGPRDRRYGPAFPCIVYNTKYTNISVIHLRNRVHQTRLQLSWRSLFLFKEETNSES